MSELKMMDSNYFIYFFIFYFGNLGLGLSMML